MPEPVHRVELIERHTWIVRSPGDEPVAVTAAVAQRAADAWLDEHELSAGLSCHLRATGGSIDQDELFDVVMTSDVVVGKHDGEWTWSARWQHWRAFFHSMWLREHPQANVEPGIIDGDQIARGNVWEAIRAFDKAHRVQNATAFSEDDAYLLIAPSEQEYTFCEGPNDEPQLFDESTFPALLDVTGKPAQVAQPSYGDTHDAAWADDDDFGAHTS